MYKFISMPPGTTLQEVRGAKGEVWMAHLPAHHCAGCDRAFTQGKSATEYKTIAHKLPIPVIFSCPLCAECTRLVRQGGAHEQGVLEAIRQLLQGAPE